MVKLYYLQFRILTENQAIQLSRQEDQFWKDLDKELNNK